MDLDTFGVKNNCRTKECYAILEKRKVQARLINKLSTPRSSIKRIGPKAHQGTSRYKFKLDDSKYGKPSSEIHLRIEEGEPKSKYVTIVEMKDNMTI